MARRPPPPEPQWQVQQRRAFSRWVDSQLEAVGATDLIVDDPLEKRFQDGVTLPRLLESLSGRKILTKPRQRSPKGLAGRADNIFQSMALMNQEGVRLVCLGANDIIQGQTKMVLALVWALIKHYYLATRTKTTPRSSISSGSLDLRDRDRQHLLDWVNAVLGANDMHQIVNFTTDWQDGGALLGLVNVLNAQKGLGQLGDGSTPEDIFSEAAEKHHIPRLIDASDMNDLDEKTVMLYVACFRKVFEEADVANPNGMEIVTLDDSRSEMEAAGEDAPGGLIMKAPSH